MSEPAWTPDYLTARQYIGYGVYVGHDENLGEVVIYTERELGQFDRINLTGDELDNLNRYVDKRTHA